MMIPNQSLGTHRRECTTGGRVSATSGLVSGLIQAAARIRGSRFVGSRAVGFQCNGFACACRGDADCNDMFTTALCGPTAICIDDVCWCIRN